MAEEQEHFDGNRQPTDNGGYDKLVTLTPREHIRRRPGMYIGKLGDGSQSDDGIYVLVKEVVDNSIDEFNTGYAKPLITIDVADWLPSQRANPESAKLTAPITAPIITMG